MFIKLLIYIHALLLFIFMPYYARSFDLLHLYFCLANTSSKYFASKAQQIFISIFNVVLF